MMKSLGKRYWYAGCYVLVFGLKLHRLSFSVLTISVGRSKPSVLSVKEIKAKSSELEV